MCVTYGTTEEEKSYLHSQRDNANDCEKAKTLHDFFSYFLSALMKKMGGGDYTAVISSDFSSERSIGKINLEF